MSAENVIENPLEEQLKEMEEREEKYRKEEKAKSKWNNVIAITISIYAIFAALTGLKENEITTDTLLEMDSAVLSQAQASDQWTFYDSKSVKNDMVKYLSGLLPAFGNTAETKRIQDDFQKSLNKFENEKTDIQNKATELEKARDEKIKATSERVKEHHKASVAMVFLQISIVLASTSGLLKKRTLWVGSMVVAAAGIIYLAPLLFHSV
jgi:multidrug resistance efflux pump